MSGLSSLGIINSGLKAAQAGLYVTGHNVANMATPGYSRQQPLQQDFLFTTLGYNGWGPMQLGLGTDVSCIRQLRDKFMDQSFRGYVTKQAFYDVKYAAGTEVEAILNELEGQYKFQSIIADMYDAIQELSKDPAAMDTRANFIATCIAFIEKANDTSRSLFDYQRTLNDQVKQQTIEINRLSQEIHECNELIAGAEAAGDNANDYRDKRNVALDRLSEIVNITYREKPNGMVDVLAEGQELVVNGMRFTLGLRYTAPGCEFVEPVFTSNPVSKIMDYDVTGMNAKALINLNKTVTSSKGNDNGSLKGLLAARGTQPADYTWGLDRSDPLFQYSPMDSANPYNTATPATPATLQVTGDGPGLTWDAAFPAPSGGAGSLTITDGGGAALTYNFTGYTVNAAGVYTFTGVTPQGGAPALSALPAGYSITDAGATVTASTTAALTTPGANAVAAAPGSYQPYNLFNKNAVIPKAQIMLDTLVHGVVDLVNSMFAGKNDGTGERPYSPYESEDPADPYWNGVEIFSRKGSLYAVDGLNVKYGDDKDVPPGSYIPEDSREFTSLYTIGNIIINPEILNPGGYYKIATALAKPSPGTDDKGMSDNEVVLELLRRWNSGFLSTDGGQPLSVTNYYRHILTEMADDTNEARQAVEGNAVLIENIGYFRDAMMGVSLDEEMTNMMKYQHAYNAAARIVNVIDSMLDKLINGTGRVGL